jgi:cytochrome c oxidase subunit 1
VVGLVFALVLQLEALGPGRTIVEQRVFNTLFTMHGLVMVFLFAIPAIPATLGTFVLPLMLGARNLALPRANLVGFWCWLAGALIVLASVVLGGADTGWTLYAPYSLTEDAHLIPLVFGILCLGMSAVLVGLNHVVTIQTMRPEGMTWGRVPLFAWGLYTAGLVQVLATPVLAATLLLLIGERTLGVGIFNPAAGGDPVLFQHFFWFYAHPATLILLLPAIGLAAEIIRASTGREIAGSRWIAGAMAAVAGLGFVGWGQHMVTTGQPGAMSVVFSITTLLVVVALGSICSILVGHLAGGALRLTTPMLYVLAFLFFYVIGLLGALFLAALPTAVMLHNTYFEVGQLHYVMFGSVAVALFAGLHYWWPKMFGRMIHEPAARSAALLLFVGFNLSFFTQLVMGSQGLPRRYASYPEAFVAFHRASTVGSILVAVAVLAMIAALVRSLRRGEPSAGSPWGGVGREWDTPSPPPPDNFPVR